MSIHIDPPVLERVSLLLRHVALAVLDECAIPPPDTGSTYALTQQALALLTTQTADLSREVRALADGVEAVLAVAGDADGQVAWVFDALLAGRLL